MSALVVRPRLARRPAPTRPYTARRPPRSTAVAATKAEYNYDYAGQDPINGYDLDGTVMLADDSSGSWTPFDGIPMVVFVPGRQTATLIPSRSAPGSPHVGPAQVVTGKDNAPSPSAIWKAVQPYATACAWGALTGTLVGGVEAAPAGCAVGVAVHAGEHSNDPVVRTVAIAWDVATTFQSGAKVAKDGPYVYWWFTKLLKKGGR